MRVKPTKKKNNPKTTPLFLGQLDRVACIFQLKVRDALETRMEVIFWDSHHIDLELLVSSERFCVLLVCMPTTSRA